MNFKTYIKENRFFLLCLLVYILITFPLMLNHIPYYDEAHAWTLAKFMNLGNFSDIIREEGHPILWYLILMPFAKFNINYPYPMIFINYFFCLSAIILMWIKAPFSKILKCIITFSSMFLIFFPICARNYAIGVLGLFILASLYKNKTKHPLWYSLFVILTINTHLICAFGASWFGIMLIAEMIKNKFSTKTLLATIFILISGCLLFVFPFFKGFGCESTRYFGTPGLNYYIRFFTNDFGYFGFIYPAAVLCILSFKNRAAKFFTLYTLISLTLMFALLYNGRAHHFLFLIFYLIFPFWIDIESKTNKKNETILYVLMGLLFLFPLNSRLHYFFSNNKIELKTFAERINNSNIPDNSILYIDHNLFAIIPYLKHTKLYSFCTLKALSWKDSLYCKRNEWFFDDIMAGEDYVFLITQLQNNKISPVVNHISKYGHTNYLYKIQNVR